MIVRTITLFIALVGVHDATASTCDLHAEAGKQVGSCGALVEGEQTTLSIAPAAAITSGAWKRGESPVTAWAGSIVVGPYPATPVEIEVYSGASGVMRTAFGWFPVAHFAPAEDVLYRVFGTHTIIVTGKSPILNKAENRSYQFRWMTVYVKVGADWKIAASQATRMP